ncbi:transposase [Streptomyces sp. M10(2022)]
MQSHWEIENRLHWVRDVTFDEDRSQVRTGQAPASWRAYHRHHPAPPGRPPQHRRRPTASRTRHRPPHQPAPDGMINDFAGALGGAVFVEHGRIFPTRVHSAGLLGDLTITRSGRYALREPSRGADTTPWFRPDAVTSDQRTFCHTYGRAEGAYEMVPGWSYSIVAALTSGPTSWTAPLDALRLRPGDHLQQVTADQLHTVGHRIVALGRWKAGDVPIRVVADCGYDGPYLAHQLADLPVEVCVRLRGDRVLYRDAPRRTLRLPYPQHLGIARPRHRPPTKNYARLSWCRIAVLAAQARMLCVRMDRPSRFQWKITW